MDQVPTPASALDQTPAAPADGQMQSEKKNALVDSLTRVEELCNQLRNRALGDDATPDMKEILAKPSLLHSIGDLQIDVSSNFVRMETISATIQQSTQFTELRPATMTDVQAWNVRELRICLEWAKTFEAFQKLSEEDKVGSARRHFLDKVISSSTQALVCLELLTYVLCLDGPAEELRVLIQHPQPSVLLAGLRRGQDRLSERSLRRARAH